eukprot:5209069-Pleurochrysis_carterae.AAC.1
MSTLVTCNATLRPVVPMHTPSQLPQTRSARAKGKRGAISGSRAVGAKARTGIRIAPTAKTPATTTSLKGKQQSKAASHTTERHSRRRAPPMTTPATQRSLLYSPKVQLAVK